MRREFPVSVKKAALARSDGICECGCGRAFTNHPKERPCFDHGIADYIGGEPTLENCVVLRVDCHVAKTARLDTPKIKKVRREKKRQNGLMPKRRGFLTNRDGPFKKKLDGTIVRREK